MFITLLLSFKDILYILINGPLSGVFFFCKRFLPFFSSSSYSLYFVFCRGDILILIKFSLSITSVMDYAFGVVSKKSLPYSKSSRTSPDVIFQKFYSVAFYVQIYDSLRVNFCEICKVCALICLFLHLEVQLFQNNLL